MKYLITLWILFYLAVHAQGSNYLLDTEVPRFNYNKAKANFVLGIDSFEIDTAVNEGFNIFIAYEIGEAIFNKFQSISGEIGIRFRNEHILRLAHVNLNLTEEHLSSGFATAVDGDNIEGKQFGFEAFYDIPLFFNDFYLSPSCGYYENKYNHTMLNENLEKSSFSIGAAVGIRETNIFKIKGLYYSFSIPMRINLSPIRESTIGTAIIKSNRFDNNIWLFIGYEF